jgi:hypothetical protein
MVLDCEFVFQVLLQVCKLDSLLSGIGDSLVQHWCWCRVTKTSLSGIGPLNGFVLRAI